ncbi:hypothetical protein H9P43_002281 [Blastocladiella emersonii ATCC 22665]|nr:hypothetical protein H9P43_002281 [Blastocladiella emersonii ATCC 22665]
MQQQQQQQPQPQQQPQQQQQQPSAQPQQPVQQQAPQSQQPIVLPPMNVNAPPSSSASAAAAPAPTAAAAKPATAPAAPKPAAIPTGSMSSSSSASASADPAAQRVPSASPAPAAAAKPSTAAPAQQHRPAPAPAAAPARAPTTATAAAPATTAATPAAAADEPERALNVSDALSYLEEVKRQFATDSVKYTQFLDIMKEFKALTIGTPEVIARVSAVFRGYPRLILGFNTFLPNGFRIEMTGNPNSPVRVITPEGISTPQDPVVAAASSASAASKPAASASAAPAPVEAKAPVAAAPAAPAAPAQSARPNQQQPAAQPARPAPAARPAAQQPQQQPPAQQQQQPPVARPAQQSSAPAAVPAPARTAAPPAAPRPTGSAPAPATARPSSGSDHAYPEAPAHGAAYAPAAKPPTVPAPATAPVPAPAPAAAAAPAPASTMSAHATAPAAPAAGPAPANHLDLGQAVNYVNKIKLHFIHRPEVYRQFLEILTNYQQDCRPVEEVNEHVQVLFRDAPHLIDEFKQFLPSASRPAAPAAPAAPGRGGPAPGRATGAAGALAGSTAARALQSAGAAASSTDAGTTLSVFTSRPGTPPGAMPPMGDHFPDTSAGKAAAAGNSKAVASASAAVPGAPATKKRRVAASEGKAAAGGTASKKKARTDASGASSTAGAAANSGPPPIAAGEEMELFDRIKKRINSPAVYAEFLKLLNLYAADTISLGELVERVQGFLGQRAPDLFKAFKDLVRYPEHAAAVAAGTADGAAAAAAAGSALPPLLLKPATAHMDPAGIAWDEPFTGFAKYNCPNGMDTWQQVGPSYRRIRRGVRVGQCSGRDALCRSVLNDEFVSHPPTHSDANAEDQLNVHRRNAHEEHMSRVEEERYEFDINIEANAACIRLLEPIALSLSVMREDERRAYRLPRGLGSSAPSILDRILKKLYGENAAQVADGLCNSPAVAVPLVLKRLKQKDDEWRRQKREFAKVWRESDAKNFYKALDYQGAALKANEKKFSIKTLIQEVEAAYLEAKEKRVIANAAVIHHLELPVADRSVLIDVFDLLASLSDGPFNKLRPFLESFFFSEVDPNAATAGTVTGAMGTTVTAGNAMAVDGAADGAAPGSAAAAAAAAARRRSTRKQVKPASSVTCFGNNNIYLVMRLVHMVYTRLEALKRRGTELARQTAGSLLRVNPTAIELGMQDPPTAEQEAAAANPLSYYPTTLRLLEQSLRGRLETTKFEEAVRGMFGTAAYTVFAMDKTVQAALKQVKDAVNDANTKKLLALYSPTAALRGGNRYHHETLTRLAAEDIVAKTNHNNQDHVYRLEYHHPVPTAAAPSASGRRAGRTHAATPLGAAGPHANSYVLTVQLLSSQDFVNGDEAKWSQYVEQYTGSGAVDTEGYLFSASGAPTAAARSTRSRRSNEQQQPAGGMVSGDESGTGAAPIAVAPPFLRRSWRQAVRGLEHRAAKGKQDHVEAHGGLQLKICINTYRLFYIAQTEDSFVRVRSDTPAPAPAPADQPRLAKLAAWWEGPQGWNRDATGDVGEVDRARTDRVTKWFLGIEPARPRFATTRDPESGIYTSRTRANGEDASVPMDTDLPPAPAAGTDDVEPVRRLFPGFAPRK